MRAAVLAGLAGLAIAVGAGGATRSVAAPGGTFEAVSASAGDGHFVALKADGTVWQWGNNRNQATFGGQFQGLYRPSPMQIAGLANVTKVAVGGAFGLALQADGTVMAWGDGWNGELGNADHFGSGNSSEVTVVNIGGQAVDIAAGEFTAYALKADGTVWSWGYNALGETGRGTSTYGELTPGPVSGLPPIASISSKFHHVLGLAADGTVWAWGRNEAGELGDGSQTSRNSPVQVQGLPTGSPAVTAVSAGDLTSLALLSDGTVMQWGRDVAGGHASPPTLLPGLNGIVEVSAGRMIHFARDASGSGWTWGYTLGSVGWQWNLPQPLSGTTGVIGIANGYSSYAVLTSSGIMAWGDNAFGQLGDGTTFSRDAPAPVLEGPLGIPSCRQGFYGSPSVPTECFYEQAPSTGPVTWTADGFVFGIVSGPVTRFFAELPGPVVPTTYWPATITATWVADGESHTQDFVYSVEPPAMCNWTDGSVLPWGASVNCFFTPKESWSPTTWSAAGFGNVVSSPTGFQATAVETGPASVVATWSDGTTTYTETHSYTVEQPAVSTASCSVIGSVSLGAVVTCSFVPGLDGGTFMDWVAQGFSPDVSRGEAQHFVAATRGAANITARWEVGGQTQSAVFTFDIGGVEVVSISPAQIPENGYVGQITVIGDGFQPGAAIHVEGPGGLRIPGTEFRSPTELRFSVGWLAPPLERADYEVTVVNPDGHVSQPILLRVIPSPILTHPTTISAGGSHSLALDEDGELWFWGTDSSGQLPWPRPLRPHYYTFPAQLASLDGGGYYSMGMTATGDVWTWGYDAYGQMGDGPGGGAAPFNVPLQASALAVSAGSSHSFALLADGTLWAWGMNDRGQLGLGYATPYPSDPLGVESPQPVALTDVVAIAAAEGGAHTLALKSDGTVWGWGESAAILTSPPAGGWPFEPIIAPQQVPGLTGVTAIAAAGYRSLALKSDGTVWQWDAWGGLQQVQGLPVDIVAITAGPSSAHALTSTGEVYGWGNNYRGSVGDGTFEPRPTAVQLSLPVPVVQISDGGGDHSLALLADGRIFAWGANGAGVLGIGTEVDTPTPTQVLFGPSDTVTCSGEQWPTRYPFSISCSSDLAPGSGPVTWTAVGLTPGTQNGTSVSFATALPEDDPLPASWPVVIEASWTDPQGNPRTVTMPRTVESPASCSGGQTTSVFCSFVVGGTFGTWSATGFSPEYSENSWQEFTRQPFTSGTITATFAGRQQVFDFPWVVPPPPSKHVFLAWAGQRVILEHDWRTPPGDASGVEPNGSCLFASPTPIRYVKGSGPGNFLPGLGAVVTGMDEALVTVDPNNRQELSQVPSDPQGACISRALFESEDQGQVDIEAFPDPGDPLSPKATFVIFYMKLESVSLSLEAALAKPSVNATNGDFAPGNPWAPSSGAVTVTRNISTDLLVRGRVKGFFTNNNPSGRPGTSNLPPDRWVMPDDWALLAGGPADPADGSDAMGTAEQFRPYYDIMSAPNSGLACSGLEGMCAERSIGEDTVGYPPGPFVGPYSVLDIPGISSAALGSSQPFSIRETILRDGDIDMWDAPMPPALVSVDIRGAGYLRQVRKQDVYYLGDPDMQGPGQSFPNLFYRSNIPDSPFIPAVVPGGGYFWDSWGNDGPGGNGQGAHEFWTPVLVGVNAQGASDPTLTQDDLLELEGIAAAAGDSTIARTLVVYSDNHGEFMVAANGKFKAASGSCEPSPVAGTSTITAVADYPDFRGKHFTVASNVTTVTWTPDALSIASLSPGTVVAGSENVELTLTGSGFVPGVSQVCLNGAPLSTTVSSSTEATAVLPGPAATTTYLVRVANATVGGGTSNVLVLLGTVQPTSVSETAVVTNDDPEETVTVSTPPPQPEAPPVITVETSAGTGTVAVAIYETNPGETPTFAIGSGGGTGTFVDAYVSPTSTFTSTTIVICDPNGGDVAYWWDGAAWSPASDQSFDANTGCITVTVTPDTSPDIADLSGTIFAAALGYAPVIQSVSVTPELVPVGSAVTASVAFADRDLPQDAHTATWNWGDGSMSQGPAGTAATHQYLLPGVYTVSVSVTDSDGATASTSFRYVVVYDPGGGFVSGGGWIDSPAGAYAADPTLTGKATFGFVSQYKKGATVPTGKTEFQFHTGNLNFRSTSYEWLVVAGAKAQFKGVGTINGQGSFRFFITAIDGDGEGGGKPDRFRIRIWDASNGGLVYDNQLNAPDDADPTTVLGGGSIVVHR